jgi:TetR/AcrR family transcriptional repressor of nem operon
MGHSQAAKALTRERMLTEASAQIREEGLESVSVSTLMRKANLTHGGFYVHFDSRADLLVEALRRALEEGAARARTRRGPERTHDFAGIVRGYLSRTHRDAPRNGCAIGALVSDVGRAGEPARAVMSTHIESFFELVVRALGDVEEGRAITAVSAMVGALALSRVVVDPKRSDAILRAVRERLLEQEKPNGP